jgi:hypothetical protein
MASGTHRRREAGPVARSVGHRAGGNRGGLKAPLRIDIHPDQDQHPTSHARLLRGGADNERIARHVGRNDGGTTTVTGNLVGTLS